MYGQGRHNDKIFPLRSYINCGNYEPRAPILRYLLSWHLRLLQPGTIGYMPLASGNVRINLGYNAT